MNRVSTEGYKAKFGYVCMVCLEPGGEVHHITPLAAEGKDNETNWINLCNECHRSEHRGWKDRKTFLRIHKFYFEAKFLAEGPFWEGLPRSSEPQMKQTKSPHPKVPKFILDRPEEKVDARIQPKPLRSIESDYARVTRECPQCHSLFDPGKWKGQYKRRFCSTKCRWDYHNRERLDAVKRIQRLAVATRVMAKMVIKLTDSIYPDPFKVKQKER